MQQVEEKDLPVPVIEAMQGAMDSLSAALRAVEEVR
jgi:hypothetical protein